METIEKYFVNMYLVAALMAYSPHSLSRIDKEEPRRQKFYFHDTIPFVYTSAPDGPKKMNTPTLDQINVWYTAGILMYPPNYPACLEKIKVEVHS
jgi:hypothetical protein